MRLTVKCDKCGKVVEGSNTRLTDNDEDYCSDCWKEYEIDEMEEEIKMLQLRIDSLVTRRSGLEKKLAERRMKP